MSIPRCHHCGTAIASRGLCSDCLTAQLNAWARHEGFSAQWQRDEPYLAFARATGRLPEKPTRETPWRLED